MAGFQVSTEGEIYAMMPSASGPILRISSDGRIREAVTLKPPTEGLRPVRFFVSGNRAAVQYVAPAEKGQNPKKPILVVDLSNGEPMGFFDSDMFLSCYVASSSLPDRFTFFGGLDGKIQILVASE